MTGPEHHREAEKLLRAAAETADAGHSAWCQQQAHVHATLALAAATEPVRPAASEDTIEQTERDMPGWVRALKLTPEPWGHWCCQAGAMADPSPCPWHPTASEDIIEQAARTMHRADRYRIADDWDAMDDNGRSVYLDCARALAAAGLLPTPTHDVLYATRDEAYRELFTLRACIEKTLALIDEWRTASLENGGPAYHLMADKIRSTLTHTEESR